MQQRLARLGTTIFAQVRTLSPYLAIELLLPGGSLIALALWLYNRKSART
jgi:hypothetical protein